MKLEKRTIKIFAGLLGGAIVLNWLLNHFDLVGGVLRTVWGLLFPFVLGYIVAFLLNLPMSFFERTILKNLPPKARRLTGFLLTLVLVLGVLALVLGLLVPQLIQTALLLSERMPTYLQSAEAWLSPYLNYVPAVEQWVNSLDLDWGALVNKLTGFLSSGAGNLVSSAVGVATSIIGGVVSLFVGIVFACYLLLDKEHLTAQLKGLLQAYLPAKRFEKLTEIGTLSYRVYANFVSGQFLEAALLTVVYLLILGFGGFEYALLISVVIGVASLIPLIGAYVGCFIGVFLLLVSMGFWRAVVFIIIMVVVQQIEGNLIYPHVIGTSVGLPAVWMLVAVMVGGGIAGMFGMLFFIPLFSVLYTLLHRDARQRLHKKGIASPVEELPKKPLRRRRAGADTPPSQSPAGENGDPKEG